MHLLNDLIEGRLTIKQESNFWSQNGNNLLKDIFLKNKVKIENSINELKKNKTQKDLNKFLNIISKAIDNAEQEKTSFKDVSSKLFISAQFDLKMKIKLLSENDGIEKTIDQLAQYKPEIDTN